MSADSNETLRATGFDPKPSASPIKDETPAQTQRGVWLAGIVGVILLAFVVFVLPSLAPNPAERDESASTNLDSVAGSNGSSNQSSASEIAANKVQERSPFAEAQLAKARRAAQEALQSLLETQARLEARAVKDWAPSEFSDATSQAIEGDQLYRDQEFGGAETKYLMAQSKLDALEVQLPEEVATRLEKLIASIEASQTGVAESLSQTLAQMAPDSTNVIETVERVAAMPEVAMLIEKASDLFSERELSSALEKIQEAIALDPAHKRLQALWAEYSAALNNEQFLAAMTRGFEALEANNFIGAKKAFNLAATLKPTDKSPAVALDQVKEKETLSKLNRLVQSAREFELSEAWDSAADAYRDALTLDPSLIQASEGLAVAEPMSKLFDRLQTIIDKSARLVDPSILSDAQATVAEATSNLKSKSEMPKLDALLTRVQAVVQEASTPLPVTFLSDGATEVTIKRVAKLGTLTSRVVSLRPGQYQVLGSRDGFRDVLVTLNAGVNRENQITISCTEAVGR